MDTSTHSKIPRKSYTREFKLRVVEHYREAREGNTKTRISDTARHFNLDDSNVRRWLKSEIKLKHSPKGAKSHGSGWKSFFPELEKQIHEEFTEIRKQGLEAKSCWFKSRAAEISKGSNFKCSKGWFNNFKKRFHLSHRASASRAHKTPLKKWGP